jgi:hypothetical protein
MLYRRLFLDRRDLGFAQRPWFDSPLTLQDGKQLWRWSSGWFCTRDICANDCGIAIHTGNPDKVQGLPLLRAKSLPALQAVEASSSLLLCTG